MTKNEALIRSEAINTLACDRPEMPDDIILQSEQCLFLGLRALYFQRKQKFITTDQAVREKAKLINTYLTHQMWEDIFHSDMDIHIAINKMTAPLGSRIADMTESEAKETLHKVIALYDGRMTVKEMEEEQNGN